jgi:hypothetical protein
MQQWSPGAARRVPVILFAVTALFASFLTFDWTQYWLGTVRLADPELMYTRITKTLTSLLVFILVFTIGGDGADPEDTKRLKRCYAAIFSGDLLFLMDELSPHFDIAAIAMFLAGHLLVIARNGRGFPAYIRGRKGLKGLLPDILSALCIVTVTVSLFIATLYDHLKGTPLLYILSGYSVVLVTSLWTGWASVRIGRLPRVNTVLIACGASCFFVGDYLVGFNLSLGATMGRATTLFLTWVFYTPAILLIALSGYRWGPPSGPGGE